MALWICTECTCTYSVGAARCPQCGGRQYVEEGSEDMAKITVHGGASNAAADEPEAGEDVSAGTSSSTSSETPSPSTEPNETPPPSRARKTGSRSGKGRTGSSTARGTDGGPTDGTSATDADGE